jgi:aspartyl-tRNA(Asn)/glutamyl-tRNA(Gln) amidotransferase subunit C
MAAEIDETQVRHIARLARLNLTPREVVLFAGQLAEILDYFDQLQTVDTEGVEPMAHALPLKNVMRDDLPRPGLDVEAALANAPQREGPFFKVPPVLDQGGGT